MYTLGVILYSRATLWGHVDRAAPDETVTEADETVR
jgi:hypothetical protein